jgi:predicted naringenin-chalcone synthase
MDQPPLLLKDFRSLPLKHAADQHAILEWIAAAHAQAECVSNPPLDAQGREEVTRLHHKRVLRFGCSTDRIRTRQAALDDFTHRDWDRMRIFSLNEAPSGRGCAERNLFFQEVVSEAFQRFYEGDSAPDALIHVTCTGYISPSGAQRLVSGRGWGGATRVFHAYHMGCYASLPALAIARGLAATGSARIDIAHTELCTLHLDPLQHGPEELVVQTLFADGLIRYTAAPPGPSPGPSLEVMALHEEILPGTEDEMSWMVSGFGMRMVLSRHVPDHIRANLGPFLERLAARAGVAPGALAEKAWFAIHPGGPRIIDEIASLLNLQPWQVAASNRVLLDRGNMSSATLPQVWRALLEDPEVPEGAWIVALAFGPGLTVSGGMLRKTVA